MRMVKINDDFEIVDLPVRILQADERPYHNGYIYDEDVKSSKQAAQELLTFKIADCNAQINWHQEEKNEYIRLSLEIGKC